MRWRLFTAIALEPRLLAEYSGDDKMISTYKEDKDLYATIAQDVYKNSYWDNMEHHEDGSPNPEGKKRRNNCKSILLGIMYGRGAASIAEQIGESYQEAQKIIDDFYNGFPKVKEWMDNTITTCKKVGYVEDFWGRRRRLPEIQLPKYEVDLKDKESSSNTFFNPLLGSKNKYQPQKDSRIIYYEKALQEVKSKSQFDRIKQEAFSKGVAITENTGYISQAERQSINARIQGSASTMSKKAMILVHNDSQLKELGFHLMIPVHDELVGECPSENAEQVAERLTSLMKISALPECTVPFKCDPCIEPAWSYEDYTNQLKEVYEQLCDKLSSEAAFEQICLDRTECTREQLAKMLSIDV